MRTWHGGTGDNADFDDDNVFFINQLREKIGVMFGNPETTTGGNALKFYVQPTCRCSPYYQ